MKTYTITDKISGTIVAENVTADSSDFPIYDTGDSIGLLGYSKADVAEFLGTKDFELVVTQTEEI